MITIHDIYQDINHIIDYFNTLDYTENNVYGMPRLNKVLA